MRLALYGSHDRVDLDGIDVVRVEVSFDRVIGSVYRLAREIAALVDRAAHLVVLQK